MALIEVSMTTAKEHRERHPRFVELLKSVEASHVDGFYMTYGSLRKLVPPRYCSGFIFRGKVVKPIEVLDPERKTNA
jgi:hypothetical protein